MITRLLGLALLCLPATALFGQSHEREPNDTPATATKVALGATAIGELTAMDSITYNADWWTFDATAGDTLDFEADGAVAPPLLELYAPDGTTNLTAGHDYPHVGYIIKTTGTYFLKVNSDMWGDYVRPALFNYYEIGLYTSHHPKPPCAVANDGEPDDVPATARSIALGQRIDGMLCPSGDVDYYRFHATRRMRVQIRIDRDTGSKPASWGNPFVEEISPNRDTHAKKNNDWTHGSVSEFWAPEDGDYYARVTTGGGVNIPYSLTVQSPGLVPDGPGDPVTTLANNLGHALGLAAGPHGDIYVSAEREQTGHATILQVSPTGRVSTFVPDCECAVGSLAFDSAGNLFVAGILNVWKASPAGVVTQFLHSNNNEENFAAVAVAPDGTIWVNNSFPHIKQFDRQGQLLQSYDVSGANPTNPYGLQGLAFAPDGILYFAAGDGLYRLVSGKPELFVRDTTDADLPHGGGPFGTFVFDVNGNLYVPHRFSGGVSVYDRTGAEIAKPFAWIPGEARALAFGRNPDGSANSCLFGVTNSSYTWVLPLFGSLVQLRPSSVPVPGCRSTVPQVTVDDAVAELLHPGRLSAQQLTALDQQGNNNGRYDIGDLRAFLIANGAKQVP